MLSGTTISARTREGNTLRRRHFSGVLSRREGEQELFPPKIQGEGLPGGDTIANSVSGQGQADTEPGHADESPPVSPKTIVRMG